MKASLDYSHIGSGLVQ